MVNVYFCVIDAHTLKILAALRQQRNHNIKLWFDSCYSSNKVVSCIKDKQFVRHEAIDNNLNCYRWDVAAENVCRLYDADNEQRHLVSRYVSDSTDFICIDNVGHANNQIVFFQDAIHRSDYPQKFVKFPCYSTIKDLFECLSKERTFQFSLEDAQRFIKCSGIKPV